MTAFDDSDLEKVRQAATSQRVAALLGVELRSDGSGCCPFHDDSRPSFKAYSGGGWKCFAGCGGGPDGISLWMAKTGERFPEAVRSLADRMGVHIRERGQPPRRNEAIEPSRLRSQRSPGSWQPSSMPPADLRHPELGSPDEVHLIRDAEGRLFGAHARWRRPNKSKEVRWWRDGTWSLGGLRASQAPLYGAEHLSGYDRDAPLYLVEGERACDALRGLGAPAVATVCGAACLPGPEALAALAGWAGPLILWADADVDGTGKRHMERLAEALVGAGLREVRVFLPAEELPDGGDAVEWIEARSGRPVEEIRAELAAQAQSTPAAPADPFPDYDVEAFLRLQVPPRVWLAEGLIAERGLAMIHAKRGVGKTHFVLGLACAIAAGEPFLRYRVPAPAGVLLVDGEMPAPDLQTRLHLNLDSGARLKAPLRLLCADLAERSLPSLATPEGQQVIERKLDQSIRLLILDSISTLCQTADASENDAASWNAVQGWLLKLRRQGLAVLLVHHGGKDGRQRGTSKREDVLDQVVLLQHPADYRPAEGARFEVHLEKGRQARGDLAAPFEASLTGLDGHAMWTWRPLTGTDREEEIRQLALAGTSVRAIAAEVQLPPTTAHRVIRRMQERGDLPDPRGRGRKRPS